MYFLKEKINSKLLEAIITLSNGKEITVAKLISLYNDAQFERLHPRDDEGKFSKSRSTSPSRQDKIKSSLTDLKQKTTEAFDSLNNLYKELLDLEDNNAPKEEIKKKEAEIEVAKEKYEKAIKAETEVKKQIAKENYHPKSIAGVSKGPDMSFEQADSGKVNPNYKEKGTIGYDSGYTENCQSCVVCFEMRRRGYNVETLPNRVGSTLDYLSSHFTHAWIDKETGAHPFPEPLETNDVEDLVKLLEKKVDEDKRYTLTGKYRDGNYGHIFNVYKKNGKIYWYDPQGNVTYSGEELNKNLSKFILNGPKSPKLLRIDNLSFDPDYMNKIVKKST